jgi:hypothetical protein
VRSEPTASGNFSVRSASQINSGTTPAAVPLRDTSAYLDVLVTSANGDTGLTLLQYLDNNGSVGLLVSSTTVTASSTPKTVRIAAPQNFQWLKVSSTVAITNTLASATLIQSK